MGLTTGAEALRAARWVNPIFVHYVHTFDERPWTPTAFFRFSAIQVRDCVGCAIAWPYAYAKQSPPRTLAMCVAGFSERSTECVD